MDDRLTKFIWFILAVNLLSVIFVDAQDNKRHGFPTTRRRLPTAIITREHLRRQQQQRSPTLYGPIGDTAAEFIVSAALDNGKSSAVRIRKITTPKDNSHKINDTSANEVSRRHPIANGLHQRRQPEYHPPIAHNRNNAPHERPGVAYGGQQHTVVNSPGLDLRIQSGLRPQVIQNNNQQHTYQRQPELHPQNIRRRQDVLNERHRVPVYHQRFYPTMNVNVQKGPQLYVPPIFVPNYQQNRDGQSNLRNPGTGYQGSVESVTNSNSDEGLRTSSANSGRDLFVKHDTASDEFVHDLPLLASSEDRKPTNEGDSKDSVHKTIDSEHIEDVKKTQPAHKHIVAETPVLRLKPEDVKNYLIRRPSLVLRDQIIVNEVSQNSDKPRYGPRALRHDQESSTGSRRKRRATNLYSLAHLELKRTSGMKNTSDELIEVQKQNNSTNQNDATNHSEALPSPVKVWGDFRNREERVGKNYPFRHTIEDNEAHIFQSNSSENSDTRFDLKTPYYSSEYVSDQSSESSEESDGNKEDVMSFSDFLASPIAEKIRLERQRMFRNTSQWMEENSPTDFNSTHGLETVMQNSSSPLLRNIIAARLLHGILNADRNYSNNATDADADRTNSRSSPDSITSAEQRQFGIVVSPYDSLETMGSRSTMPIIRILRGKIVPLPDLPQELIPILMGTYRPTQMSETSIDDPKLTENILDNAILSLLQSDDAMGWRPSGNRKMRPYAPRYNRKSPSTNYVGSVKASEPQVVRTKYSFSQPNEWSLGPRCDRLTEEICLDDSDYPSSAILSSVYKDKAKFDLMYAEVKVRESQVEGLSRQQEQAYSLDHYFGASGVSNQDPRDYGGSGGFVCPSEVHYGRPHRAKNRRGEWKVVVNVGEYTQTLRMEKCLASGNPCKYVVAHVQSTCAQVYSYHRLLVFNKDSGLHIDLFRVPTGCACHLRSGQHSHRSTYSEPVHRPAHQHEEFGGHVETAPMPQTMTEGSVEQQRPSSFGSTLWAILGGGPQAGALAQQPHFLDEVQKQIGWTKQMKQHPHLLKQISPNQVLKQLLDIDDDDDYNIRRLRIRTKPADYGQNAGGYASHHIPISVPVPPPPPRVIARRPVVSAATPDMFGRHPPKVITISSSSDQPTKVFSLTKDAGSGGVRISEVSQQPASGKAGGGRNTESPDQQQSSSNFHHVKAYKIRPGMYHPSSSSGETMQFSEASLVPVAPQFSSDGGSEPGLRPVLRPMKNSDKRIVEDADLIAIEKSEDGEIHAFKVETVTKDSSEDEEKINFSYHPILEYLNL